MTTRGVCHAFLWAFEFHEALGLSGFGLANLFSAITTYRQFAAVCPEAVGRPVAVLPLGTPGPVQSGGCHTVFKTG